MYREKSKEELQALLKELNEQYAQIQAKGLKLDMSRGKQSPEQLDLSMDIMDTLSKDDLLVAENGADCRSYGVLDGIPEAKRMMAEILDVDPSEVFLGGTSLNLMHDMVSFCWLHPLPGCDTPWGKQPEIKFLCPCPGYDRHFNVTAHFGIQNVVVPMTAEGPDMDVVEQMVQNDASIKGIWCVPKYSNPTGITYSDEVVRRLANLKPAAKDFRIFWDNAYGLHDLYDDRTETLLPLMAALKEAGNPNMAFQFCSFAKVTFGGASIAAVAASADDMAYINKHMALQMICADKVNQLRHARYFDSSLEQIKKHMKKHAALLRPKFEIVLNTLEEELGGLGIAAWTNPLGGYFVSLDVPEGCAKRVVALCKGAGVTMTPAGATFPYGNDPADRNIRIAPSYPSVEELRESAKLLCLCTKIAAIETMI